MTKNEVPAPVINLSLFRIRKNAIIRFSKMTLVELADEIMCLATECNESDKLTDGDITVALALLDTVRNVGLDDELNAIVDTYSNQLKIIAKEKGIA